jgi:hypothetical protein
MNIKAKGVIRYPHLITPSSAKNSDTLSYSVQILIHKTDPQCAMITQVIDDLVRKKYPNEIPEGFKYCWKDMGIKDPKNSVLKNYMSLVLSTKVGQPKPYILDENRQPIIDPETDSTAIGHIGWVVGGLETYTKGSVGIKMYLNLIMVTSEFGPIAVEHLISKANPDEMYNSAIDMTKSLMPMTTPPTAPIGQPVAPPIIPAAQPVAPPIIPAAQPVAPPIIPAAQPVAPPTVPGQTTIPYQMTELARGATREAYIQQGWTDEMLIAQGLMLPPNGVQPSFIV